MSSLRRSPRRDGFTLIELLLVLAIFGIVAAVTVPSLVKSMRGHRLRAATRTVVMAGRYARSMALMKQDDFTVGFDLASGTVTVRQGAAPAPALDAEAEPPPSAPEDAMAAEGDGSAAPPSAGAGRSSGLRRVLERVRIESVEFTDADGDFLNEGVVPVRYELNGRCRPYRVRLVDEQEGLVEIDVDAFGTARTSLEGDE